MSRRDGHDIVEARKDNQSRSLAPHEQFARVWDPEGTCPHIEVNSTGHCLNCGIRPTTPGPRLQKL